MHNDQLLKRTEDIESTSGILFPITLKSKVAVSLRLCPHMHINNIKSGHSKASKVGISSQTDRLRDGPECGLAGSWFVTELFRENIFTTIEVLNVVISSCWVSNIHSSVFISIFSSTSYYSQQQIYIFADPQQTLDPIARLIIFV